jgi:hypothetical protein
MIFFILFVRVQKSKKVLGKLVKVRASSVKLWNHPEKSAVVKLVTQGPLFWLQPNGRAYFTMQCVFSEGYRA